MNHSKIIALCFLITSTTVFASKEAVKINSKIITEEVFNKKYQDAVRFFQYKAPTKKEFVNELITREVVVQEARTLGLDKDADIQERINTVLYQAVLEKKLSGEFEKIHVEDKDAETYYQQSPEIRTSHIFVSVKPNPTKEEEKGALEKITTIKNKYLEASGENFSEIAQRYSEGVNAAMGGDMDFQTRDRLDPIFYDAATKLKSPGKISGIVRSPLGFHIIKLTSIHSWEEVDKAKIKRLVFEKKRQEIFERYVDTLRKRAKITTNSDILKN